MKKGFALLETIIVITFLSIALLMLYGTFTNMVSNSRKNVFYDNVSDIYKTYYLKEYLMLDNLEELTLDSKIREVNCSDFNINSCNKLVNSLAVEKMYIVLYDLKDYEVNKYSTGFNSYINSLSNKSDFKYRFLVEFKGNSYASIGLGGDNSE